ncbi:hypothetical protein MNBD_GAMMA08-3165, partial [hydrothermal vent metagenome]
LLPLPLGEGWGEGCDDLKLSTNVLNNYFHVVNN